MRGEEGFVVGFFKFSWTGKKPAIHSVQCLCWFPNILPWKVLVLLLPVSKRMCWGDRERGVFSLYLEEICFLFCSACILNFIFTFLCQAKCERAKGQCLLRCGGGPRGCWWLTRARWGGRYGALLPSGPTCTTSKSAFWRTLQFVQAPTLWAEAAESWSIIYERCPFLLPSTNSSGVPGGRHEAESQETPQLAAFITPSSTRGRKQRKGKSKNPWQWVDSWKLLKRRSEEERKGKRKAKTSCKDGQKWVAGGQRGGRRMTLPKGQAVLPLVSIRHQRTKRSMTN